MKSRHPALRTVRGVVCGGLLATFLIALLNQPLFAQTAESYRQQGVELSRKKSWDEAIVSYQKALELGPGDPLTHYNLALALKYKGDQKQAVEEFQATLRLKPKWADPHYA